MKNKAVATHVYKNLLENLKQEQKSLASGSLIIRNKRYYQRNNRCDSGITRNLDLVRQLARKRYINILIKVITEYLNTPLKDIHEFNFPTHEQIINTLPSTFQELPESYFQISSLDAWISKPIKTNPNYTEALIYPTKGKYKVRSKEEVILSNALVDHNIPHKYEAAYQLGPKTVYPDYTIINSYTGKQLIWEHIGGFHIENYGESAHKKIIAYIKNGLILDDTLIITYNDDIRTTGRVEEIIKKIILKI